jgi:hypothetical protein
MAPGRPLRERGLAIMPGPRHTGRVPFVVIIR